MLNFDLGDLRFLQCWVLLHVDVNVVISQALHFYEIERICHFVCYSESLWQKVE